MALNKLRRGADAITKATERTGGGRFTPTHYWKDSGDYKYLHFISSIEEIPTVLMHSWIKVGERDDGNPKYQTFISRKDPGLDGAEGYDPIWTRFNLAPKERNIAVAVEVEPIHTTEGKRKKITGFKVVERTYKNSDGEEVNVPNVGYVIESPHTFFGYLATYSDDQPIEDVVFKVTRKGKKTDTAYHFVPVGQSDDIEEYDKPDDLMENLDEYIENLSSEDNIRKHIDPLPDDAVLSPWQNRGKSNSRPSSSKSSRFNAGDEDTDTDDTPTPRSKRFTALKDEVG